MLDFCNFAFGFEIRYSKIRRPFFFPVKAFEMVVSEVSGVPASILQRSLFYLSGSMFYVSKDKSDKSPSRIQAIMVLNMIKLYGKPIHVNKASQDKKGLDVGTHLFVGNLDPDVDEKLLYDTFSAFGLIVTYPKHPMHTRKLPKGSVMVPQQRVLAASNHGVQKNRPHMATPFLQVDHLHYRMVLRLMVPWGFLLVPLQMVPSS
ncbi:oligouridylate-binding protein 1A-like [Macadamia integrifolia]|uniref:oligouridylate-binding protein 1A-like n=1 Tax=Macadamia integrifolia TaxID=60698 RepID=UPI001C533A4B|nr:oligouridylate-binding protein 1A-like [Macadamia integrifolia]